MDLLATDAPHVLVVTGMSGAGRSSAADILEDLGYTVIDNLPPQLLSLAAQAHDIPEVHKHLAVVIDSRGGLPTDELRYAMTEMEREGVVTRIVFLDADDSVIVRRYDENRRPHPLGMDTIEEAIVAERELLEELREMADVVIDTSNLTVRELKERLESQFSDEDLTRHYADVLATTIIVRYALSFDGLATKVNHHRTVSEYFTAPEQLKRNGFDRLIRLAVGLEDADDLIAALNWTLHHGDAMTTADIERWQRERLSSLEL